MHTNPCFHLAGVHLLPQPKNSKMPPKRIPAQDFYEGPRWGRGFAYWIPEIWSALKNKLQKQVGRYLCFESRGLKFGISVNKWFRMMWFIFFSTFVRNKWVRWKKMVDVWLLDVGVLKFGISEKKVFRPMWLILVFDICFGNVDTSDLASPNESSFARRIGFRRKSLPSPEEASFIREIFLRHENLSSSAESSVARRIIFR